MLLFYFGVYLVINKFRAKQCRRYVQSSNEDEFEFLGSPSTSINTRIVRSSVINQLTVSRAKKYLSITNELSANILAIIHCLS